MEDLSTILVKLSQRILNVNQSRKLKLAKLLLNSLDPLFFSQSSLMSISTFSQMSNEISSYYKQKFNERIRESFFYQIQLDDKFLAFYKLIMDMALSGQRKEEFLNAILDMTENEKNLLMEFVAQVVRRDEFIDFTKQDDEKLVGADSIIMEEKFLELKEEYKEFERIYYQLLEGHQSLKKNHEKVVTQLTHIKEEKYQLLCELGLHHNAGYIDIIQKYRKDVQEFTEDTAKLTRQIEQKTAQIKIKQKQNQQLILSFSVKQQQLSTKYEDRIFQLVKKQTLIEKKLQDSSQKEEEYRFQILRLKEIIIDLRKQVEDKNNKLYQQEVIIDKYNKMKKLHLQFRKVMVENYRNGLSHLAPTTSGGISL